MNKIKQLIILFVGIFIGYLIADFTSNNISEDINLSQAKPSPTIKSQVISEEVTAKNNKEINIQSVLPVIKQPNNLKDATKPLSNTSVEDLENKYQQLNQAYQRSKNKVSLLQRQLDELDDSDITTAQMEDLVVEPFKDHVGKFTGVMRDQVYNFHQTEDDFDWGYNMQNAISDFILTHYHYTDINLVSVLCKAQKCELLVIENIEGSWNKIAQELAQQPWWKFTSTYSFSGNVTGSENSLAIYNFLSV